MAMNGTITIVSSKGNGQPKKVTIARGMTLKEIFFAELGIADPDKFAIHVNCKAVDNPNNYKPKPNDVVIITPVKIKANG